MVRSEIGVDIGGTFTDLLYVDEETGERKSAKSSSTADAITGILNVLEKVDINPDEVSSFGHGSTIATNAIIEQTGADTALVTTANFPDVLEAARANRPELFDLSWQKADTVVSRRDIFGIEERILYDGSVDTALNEDDVHEAAELINERGYEAVAISFMNAFVNPDHERRTLEILEAACPDKYVTASSEVVREIGEFERTSTTALNAYLGPLLAEYIDALDESLASEFGYEGEVTLVNSAGGAANRQHAINTPARFCNSGPAGGVNAARYLGGLAGYDDLITFDMGGTSSDLSLVEDGKPEMTTEWRVEWNKPILFPAIDIETIGAGGGSIAWIDEGGALKVGPRSAGADPGPACYDQGGTDPTITDANLVLNRLNEEMFLGGDMEIDPSLSATTINEQIGQHFGWGTHETAEAILRVAVNNMANAVRGITVERGHDPRNFTMVSYGGAGPMHAAELAADIGIPRVLVPRNPGVGSAFGVAQPDYRFDYIRPVLQKADEVTNETVNDAIADMQAEMREDVSDAGLNPDDREVTVQPNVDFRYYGQTSSINIDTETNATELTERDVERLVEQFEARFEREFGYTLPDNVSEVELVNVRLTASVERDRIEPRAAPDPGGPSKGEREVGFGGDTHETTVYDRARIDVGTEIEGPAIVEQSDTTTVVPPASTATVDKYGNLIIDVETQ